MMNFDDGAQASDWQTTTQSEFRRVLVAVGEASQVGRTVELARRSCVPGMTEARVLHLNLRQGIRGQRFSLETDAEAAYVLDATLFELRMSDIGASGEVRSASFDRAADAILEDAAEFGADLIVLGSPHRRELRTRVFGSVTLHVLQHAPCPVLVAPAANRGRRYDTRAVAQNAH